MPEDAQCSAGPAPGWCCQWPSGAVFRGRKDPGTCQLKLHPSGLGGAAGSQPPGHSCTPKTKPLMQEEDTREFRINHLLLLSSFSMLWPRLTACRILTPHPGAEPASPALPACPCRRHRTLGFDPWVGKIPWRKERLPKPVFWPGELHGLYRPWGHKESDTKWYKCIL